MKLFEVGIDVLFFLRLLSSLKAILWGFEMVGGGIRIHDTYVVNTEHTLHLEVSDEDILLQLYYVL